jgi:hypothetical protein
LAVLLLGVLAPGHPAHAGPPEGVSGAMVLDEVADGLRRYRMARTPQASMTLLRRLAPTRDPRVAVALADAAVGDNSPLTGSGRQHAAWLLMRHYIPEGEWLYGAKYTATAQAWWQRSEADLRRRAKELP